MPFVVGRSILQRVTPLAGCTVLCPTARPAWMRASLSSQGHVRTVPGRALEAGAERNCGHARLRAGASMPCNLDGGTEWFLRAEFQGSTAGQGDLRVGGVGRAVRVRGDGSCRSDSSEQLRRSQPWPQLRRTPAAHNRGKTSETSRSKSSPGHRVLDRQRHFLEHVFPAPGARLAAGMDRRPARSHCQARFNGSREPISIRPPSGRWWLVKWRAITSWMSMSTGGARQSDSTCVARAHLRLNLCQEDFPYIFFTSLDPEMVTGLQRSAKRSFVG